MTFKDAILRPSARILRWISLYRKGIPSHLAWVWAQCSTEIPDISIEGENYQQQLLCGCGWSVHFDPFYPTDKERAEEDFAKHLAKIDGFC